MNNSLEFLCTWYVSQCNGTWEHQHGITIETTDNPGWWVKISVPNILDKVQILDEKAESDPFAKKIYLADGVLNGFCGAMQLPDLLAKMRNYLENSVPAQRPDTDSK